jgi:hypothetical protein
MELPVFNADGLLPPSDYSLTLTELRDSFLVTGIGQSQSWDRRWRSELVSHLDVLAKQLWFVGIENIYVNGSFVEQKDHPNDIDGYLECERRYFASGKLQKDLNFYDDHKIWTWDPASLKGTPNSAKRQLPMWFVYRVELYPHFRQPCGFKDVYGHELQFPSAFRQRRGDSKPKGIIKLIKDVQP